MQEVPAEQATGHEPDPISVWDGKTIQYLGKWPDEKALPETRPFVSQAGDAFRWRHHLWVRPTPNNWVACEITTFFTDVQGTYHFAKDLTQYPDVEALASDPVEVWDGKRINFLGDWPDEKILPETLPYVSQPGDALKWRYHLWVRPTPDNWIVTVDPAHLIEAGIIDLEKDAGARAVLLMKQRKKAIRKKKIKKFFFWLLFWSVFLGALGGAGYWASTQVVKSRNITTKNCSVPFGKDVVTGKREYSSPTRSLFGFELVVKGEVDTQTKLDIRGNKINIIGMKDGKFAWRRNVTDGERYDQLMLPVDTYIFFNDKETSVVSYEQFCK
jgi:hypothetical protein